MSCRRIMHLFINLPSKDIDTLVATPFSLNTELQRFLAPYPESVLVASSSGMQASLVHSG